MWKLNGILCLCLFLVATATTVPAASDAPNQIIIQLNGYAPFDQFDFFFVPFAVPEGILEIEVAHHQAGSGQPFNILDWGLNDTVGYGGPFSIFFADFLVILRVRFVSQLSWLGRG
jgi:hypothetical protein